MKKLLLWLIMLALPLCALAEEAPHEYLGISFETATIGEVAQTLLRERGATLDKQTRTAEAVPEFGYDWHLQIDPSDKGPGLLRVLLSSAQEARIAPEAYDECVCADLKEFLDVEAQLTALYGEPNFRYLLSPDIQAAESFTDGRWTPDGMCAVLEAYGVLRAFSVWGNVSLGTWMDRVNKPYATGKHLSRIMLEYMPKAGEEPNREQGILKEAAND